MTAKDINDKLIALYTKYLCKFPKDEIEKSFGTDDYSNPLLNPLLGRLYQRRIYSDNVYRSGNEFLVFSKSN